MSSINSNKPLGLGNIPLDNNASIADVIRKRDALKTAQFLSGALSTSQQQIDSLDSSLDNLLNILRYLTTTNQYIFSWGIYSVAVGVPTLVTGFNVASATNSGQNLLITFETAADSVDYIPLCTNLNTTLDRVCHGHTRSQTSYVFSMVTAGLQFNFATGTATVASVVVGGWPV